MGELLSGIGIVPMLAIGYFLSSNRKAIRWRPVIWGILLQLIFAFLILKTPWGLSLFRVAGDFTTRFLNFSDAGSEFIFGKEFGHHLFAFKILPTIIFFSSFMAILYYLGVMQRVVRIFAKVMAKTMGTSGAESLSAAANIFVGQTEAPLLIRPFISKMTMSELMAVMTGGFATVAGGVMAAYIMFGVNAGHLIAASVMSAPAALAFAKLMFPELEKSETQGTVQLKIERVHTNMIEAATAGAGDGLKLALNVAAMLLAFIALIALLNALLGWVGGFFGYPNISLEMIFGWAGSPIAFFIGVPFEECLQVGSLIGQKVVINEFIAYQELGKQIAAHGISPRAEYLATYALCGFSNFSCIAIQIGGIGAIAPERRGDLARIGLRAMIAANLACFSTANIAGLFISNS